MKSFLTIYLLLLFLSFPAQAISAKTEQSTPAQFSLPEQCIEFNVVKIVFYFVDQLSVCIYSFTLTDFSAYQILSFAFLTTIFYLTIN